MGTALELSSYELHGLCQRYLKQQTEQAIATNACSLQVLSYHLQPASDAPAGFLGRHQFLSISIQLQDADGNAKQETLHFFTKSAPVENASRMEYLAEFGVFKKEIAVYREVLPQLQQIYGGIAPSCYYSANTLLVFENLDQQGYRMAAGRDGLLDYEHLQCALKTLAAMHAASIVYEVQQRKSITETHAAAVLENAYPSGISEQHVRWQNFHQATIVLKELIAQLPQYRHTGHNRIQELLPKRMAVIFELAAPSTKYQNVFTHGDLWANNIMFRYGNYGNTPLESRLVDFQLARYAPAAMDLMTLLTIPTSRSFREQHMDELLCEYYRCMTEFLKRAGLRIEDFMPLPQFRASVEEYRIVGLIESLLFSHLTILPSELTQQLTSTAEGFQDFFSRKRVEICMQAFRNDRTYRERLSDMIADIVDNFVLK